MYVQPTGAIEPKTHKVLRSSVISGERKGHNEGFSVDREEELTTIRVVVAVPDQDLMWIPGMARRSRLWALVVTEYVIASDSLVGPEEDVAIPMGKELTLFCTCFIAAIIIDRAPSYRRPADNLDRKRLGAIGNEQAIPF